MKSTPQKTKLALITHWCQPNFTNRTMLMLTGLQDALTDPEYADSLYYIDMTYDLLAPELSMAHNQQRPSKTLSAIAFINSLRPNDYFKLIDAAHTATSSELKEFLTQEIDHQPTDRVIDYMTFPLLAMMTSHLPSWEKSDILLLKPQLIRDTFDGIRSKTVSELLTKTDVAQLRHKAPDDIKPLLTVGLTPADWMVHFSSISKTGDLTSGFLDQRFVQAQGRWADVKAARRITPQTGTARKIALWLTRNHIRD